MDREVFEAAFQVAADIERMGLPQGIQAVTVGYKRTDGAVTTQPALVFLVDKKLQPNGIHPSMLIPNEIGGFATDVVEVQLAHQDGDAGPYERIEPLVGGVSIKADWKHGIGTLGAVFCNRSTRQPMGVTNRHVVDNWFIIKPNGQSVYQPTELHQNRIGTVWRHNGTFDCAAIKIDLSARAIGRERSFIGCPGRITAIGRALVGMLIFKVGAHTGRTEGIVRYSGPSRVVIRHREGAEGHPLSASGDSGSIWCCETPDGYTAVALHSKGAPGVATGLPMIEVARVLDLDILDN